MFVVMGVVFLEGVVGASLEEYAVLVVVGAGVVDEGVMF